MSPNGLFESDEPVSAYARVAPERALDRSAEGLTYGVPVALSDLAVGERVLVPLGRGNKPAQGIVIDLGVKPDLDPSKIKPITSRDPKAGGALPTDLVRLGQWISSYYCCPLGMTLASMMPAAVRHGTGVTRRTMVDLANDPASMDDAPRLTKLQRAIVDAIKSAESRPIEIHELADLAGAKTVGPINRLVDAGILKRSQRAEVEALWDDASRGVALPDREVVLTAEQAHIVDEIGASLGDGFCAHVIYGVTGSGKTEVYLRLIEQVARGGHAAIVLVPEISLTPQTVARFKARFRARLRTSEASRDRDAGDGNLTDESLVAVLHSGLTPAQRHQQWQLVRSGKAQVLIGARSAIFAPFPDDRLGIIIVDEEHDNSYKQDQAPRYHARDVAVRRAQMSGATVVLGSATPSLETYANACVRRIYRWHEIRERVPGAKLPKVEVVDLVEERRRRPRTDRHVHLLGPRLEVCLHRTLAQGGDVMLLLNRRGYANYISCPDHNCGWVMTCAHCDVAMVYHKNRELPRGGYVRCHHCLAEQILPEVCPLCGKRINTFGLGTQRIEEELERKFPEIAARDAILRMDSDTMHRAVDYDQALDRFRRSEVRILVGTQMIAKGLDFPNVRLVGVINADTAVNLPDFRASERTYQLVAQVAGRSGRGEQAGLVVVQTFQPNLPSIRAAAAHDYHGFAQREIEDRRPAALPPIGRMARIVVRHKDHLECAKRARAIHEALAAQVHALVEEVRSPTGSERVDSFAHRSGFQLPADVPPVRLRGPAPCPISRLADHHRWSIEILSAVGPVPIQRLLTALRNRGLVKSDTTTAVDVDPVHLL